MTKLTAERGVPFGDFGCYLAAQGDELFVASMKSETTRAHPGSIYAMRRQGLHWYREAVIEAPPQVVRFFGIALTVEGDTLVTGGFLNAKDIAVFVYRRSGGSWSLDGELGVLPIFESSHWAAIEGDRIAIGAARDSSLATFGGSVHVFRRGASGWQLEEVLLPGDPRPGLAFGYAVDLDAGRLVAGAPSLISGPGAAYVFERQAEAWVQTAELRVHDGTRDLLGLSLSLDGDQMAVLAREIEVAHGEGTSYVFELRGGSWIQVARASPGIVGDLLGETMELMGERLFVGGVFRGYLFRKADSGWEFDRALEPLDAEPFLEITTSAACPDFVFLGSSGQNALDIYTEASDQRALDAGAVFAYSLRGSPCASLRVTRNPISYGRHEMRIERGPENAGHLYLLLGSLSGTSPGFLLRGQRVPLNVDPYLRTTAFSPNQGLFTSNFGRLDAAGEAVIRLEVPPMAIPFFADHNADHAFIEFASGQIVHVSNVTQVRFADRLTGVD